MHKLEIGVGLAEHSDAAAGKVLRNWLENTVLTAISDRILPLNEAVAVQAARCYVPSSKPFNDAYIAATVFIHGMTLVTRNAKDFEGMGVSLVSLMNPWALPTQL